MNIKLTETVLSGGKGGWRPISILCSVLKHLIISRHHECVCKTELGEPKAHMKSALRSSVTAGVPSKCTKWQRVILPKILRLSNNVHGYEQKAETKHKMYL